MSKTNPIIVPYIQTYKSYYASVVFLSFLTYLKHYTEYILWITIAKSVKTSEDN